MVEGSRGLTKSHNRRHKTEAEDFVLEIIVLVGTEYKEEIKCIIYIGLAFPLQNYLESAETLLPLFENPTNHTESSVCMQSNDSDLKQI